VNQITATLGRLQTARTLPEILDAAYAAFEHIIAVLRHHQQQAGAAFPAFVLAAAVAGNGRDDITDAPSLARAAAPAMPGAPDLMAGASIDDAAFALAELSSLLDVRLSAGAATTASQADRACCEHAAQEAARIGELLGWARQP